MPVDLISTWIFRVLFLVLFAVEVWALINAVRFRPDAYVAADKRTKVFWCLLTLVAAVLGALALLVSSQLLLSVIAIVIAGVFLADVYPALRRVMGNAQGPYRRRR